jgi:methyl-accepting chemotaxis protein
MQFLRSLKKIKGPKIPKSLNIRMRIFLLAGLGIVGMAGLTGAYMIGELRLEAARHNAEVNDSLMGLVAQVAKTSSKLRRYESDFLLTRNKQAALDYQGNAADFSELVQKMGESPLSRSISDPILELEDAMMRHTSKFVGLVQMEEKMGLERGSGLNGDLQKQFTTIDEKLSAPGMEQLRAKLMMIVRYMRDFSLKHDEETISQIEIVREQFNFLLSSVEMMPDEEKALTGAMDAYIATIKKWAELRIMADEQMKELNAIYSEIEPALQTITTTAQKGMQEAQAVLDKTRQATFVIVLSTSAVMLVAVVIIGFLVGRSISRPLMGLTRATSDLAGGNIELEIPATERKDEIGDLARAVLIFKQNAVEKRRLEAQEAQDRAAKEERAKAVETLIQDFEAASNEALQNVLNAASSLQDTSATMASAAEVTNQQSEAVRTGAESAAQNVQTVATATEELSTSINEISEQVAQSNTVAEQAVDESRKTRETMQGLAKSAETIGDVVNLIQEIAAQTNLLALNATIEAARAGEAGKGFAVVASEVKQLANQTSKATDQIAQQIANIQNTATNAVDAITKVDSVIDQISGYSAAVASAVEEQSAATRHIADNVQQAASGTNTVTESIGGLNDAAHESAQAAQQVRLLSDNLSSEAERLKQVAHSFLENVRSA